MMMNMLQKIIKNFRTKRYRTKLLVELDELNKDFWLNYDKFFNKLKNKIEDSKSIDKKRYEKISKEINNFKVKCNICNKIVMGLSNRFKCQYCGGFFCDKHRLPENHKCVGELRKSHLNPIRGIDINTELDLEYKEDE